MGARRFALSPDTRYILALLLGTRVVLTIIGVIARTLLTGPEQNPAWVWVYTSNRPLLDIWGLADTAWYLDIVNNGYSTVKHSGVQANYAFFPLYPGLMKAVGVVVGDPYVAGIIISNAALVAACALLYKLMLLEAGGDAGTAIAAVKYMLLYPAAFVFSAVLSEGLYLALMIGCFYCVRRRDWRLAGILGFFLALTRSLGVFAFLPIVYEYGRSVGWNLRRVRGDAAYLLLIPFGFALFVAYTAVLTGDVLAYVHTQEQWVGGTASLKNPLAILAYGLTLRDPRALVSIFVTLIALMYLCVYYRTIGFAYWLVGMYSIIVPLTGSWSNLFSMLRYIAVVFPLFIIFARTRVGSPQLDQITTIVFAMLQGMLMVFWTIGANLPL